MHPKDELRLGEIIKKFRWTKICPSVIHTPKMKLVVWGKLLSARTGVNA